MIKYLDRLLEDIFQPMSEPEQKDVDKRMEELIKVDGGIYSLPDWFIDGYLKKNGYELRKDYAYDYAKKGSAGDFMEEVRKMTSFLESEKIEVKEQWRSRPGRPQLVSLRWKKYYGPGDESIYGEGSIYIDYLREVIKEDIFKPMRGEELDKSNEVSKLYKEMKKNFFTFWDSTIGFPESFLMKVSKMIVDNVNPKEEIDNFFEERFIEWSGRTDDKEKCRRWADREKERFIKIVTWSSPKALSWFSRPRFNDMVKYTQIEEDIFKPMSKPEQELADKQVETVDIIEIAISIENKFTDKQRKKLWKAFKENGFTPQFSNFSHVWEKTEPSTNRLSTLNAKSRYLHWLAGVINSMTLPWQGEAKVNDSWQHILANDKSDRVTVEVWRDKRRKMTEDIFKPMGAKELKTIKGQMETIDSVWVYIREQVDRADRDTLRKCKYKKENAENPIIRDEIEKVLYGLGYIKERINFDERKYFKDDKGIADITIKAITTKLKELGIYYRREVGRTHSSREVAWIIKRFYNPLTYSVGDRAYVGIVLNYKKEERKKQ